MKHSTLILIAGALLALQVNAQSVSGAKPDRKAKVPAAAVAPVTLVAPLDIVLRHEMSGAPLDSLATLVLRFNDEETKLKTGAGRIMLEDVQGVADRARLPHIALFDQDDAQHMFVTHPRFLPLYKVMETGKQRFDAKSFYPQMVDAVDDLAGKMQALPLALSLPVLFYNKTAFTKAKLDPNVPPKTWWELQEAAGNLRDAGSKCPLTSSRFAWVHLENVAAQHGEPLVTKNGKQDQLALNGMVNVKHVALLTSWHKSSYFIYSGPGREGDERFIKGECAMLTGESALYARIAREKPDFPLGIAVLPHYDDVHGVKPTHVLPDGPALWVLAADKKPEQQVIARFIAFLMMPETQREWVRATGFLPMSPAAVQALRESGGNRDVLDQAERRLSMEKRDSARTRPGFGRSRIRNILNEEIEFVWGDKKPAKEALDHAVARANPILTPAPAPTARK
jgi:sn-glycerol 3-phosphate transport system substrate-binding protein